MTPRRAVGPASVGELRVDDFVEQATEIAAAAATVRAFGSVGLKDSSSSSSVDVEHRSQHEAQGVDGLHPGRELLDVEQLRVDGGLDRVDARQPPLISSSRVRLRYSFSSSTSSAWADG